MPLLTGKKNGSFKKWCNNSPTLSAPADKIVNSQRKSKKSAKKRGKSAAVEDNDTERLVFFKLHICISNLVSTFWFDIKFQHWNVC